MLSFRCHRLLQQACILAQLSQHFRLQFFLPSLAAETLSSFVQNFECGLPNMASSFCHYLQQHYTMSMFAKASPESHIQNSLSPWHASLPRCVLFLEVLVFLHPLNLFLSLYQDEICADSLNIYRAAQQKFYKPVYSCPHSSCAQNILSQTT